MNSKIKIAKDMLAIAKELMAGDFSDRNTFNQITKTKTTMPEFRKLKQVFQPKQAEAGEEEDGLSDSTMDKVAEELLAVAKELMNDGE